MVTDGSPPSVGMDAPRLGKVPAGALGIENPELHVRAALILHALGDDAAAQTHVDTAQRINPLGVPYLSAADASVLDEILEGIDS